MPCHRISPVPPDRRRRRFLEIAGIPRHAAKFFERYQDRILYGFDMGHHPTRYRQTFRILESADEHYYEDGWRVHHWALSGLALPDAVLKKVYSGNARRILP
jgi:predicted TIM-barrel fold metal-dependent hydrolase